MKISIESLAGALDNDDQPDPKNYRQANAEGDQERMKDDKYNGTVHHFQPGQNSSSFTFETSMIYWLNEEFNMISPGFDILLIAFDIARAMLVGGLYEIVKRSQL